MRENFDDTLLEGLDTLEHIYRMHPIQSVTDKINVRSL